VWLLCQSAWCRSRLLYLATKLTVCLRQEKNVTPLQMNKSHICSMSKKNEKRLYLTVHRLTEPGCQLSHWEKVGEKCLLFALQCEEKPPHLKARKETAPRNINGTSCHWGWRGKKTHLHTHIHQERYKTHNTVPHSHGKPGYIRCFSGLEKSWKKVKVTEMGII